MNDITMARERCLEYGAEVLSNEELLQCVLGNTKDAKRIANEIMTIDEKQGILSLCKINEVDLLRIEGIGASKAAQVVSIAELAKRIIKTQRKHAIRLNNSESVAQYYMEDMRHLDVEQLVLVMLDSKNAIIKDTIISRGTVNATILSPREIFIEALKNNAVNIILLHNHPSGDPTPSSEDIQVTKRIAEVGRTVGIKLIDHIVIGDNSFTSLRDEEIL